MDHNRYGFLKADIILQHNEVAIVDNVYHKFDSSTHHFKNFDLQGWS